MVIGHWTHLATLVLVSPCRLGPNCFGPLFLQLCLSFGNHQPCLFGRIERPNASLLPPARTRRPLAIEGRSAPGGFSASEPRPAASSVSSIQVLDLMTVRATSETPLT